MKTPVKYDNSTKTLQTSVSNFQKLAYSFVISLSNLSIAVHIIYY
jgi:hypothetical protein